LAVSVLVSFFSIWPLLVSTAGLVSVADFNVPIFMTTRNKHVPKITTKKRGRGRPRKKNAATQRVPVALSNDLLAALDQWCEDLGVRRSAAIRRFVEEALQRGKR